MRTLACTTLQGALQPSSNLVWALGHAASTHPLFALSLAHPGLEPVVGAATRNLQSAYDALRATGWKSGNAGRLAPEELAAAAVRANTDHWGADAQMGGALGVPAGCSDTVVRVGSTLHASSSTIGDREVLTSEPVGQGEALPAAVEELTVEELATDVEEIAAEELATASGGSGVGGGRASTQLGLGAIAGDGGELAEMPAGSWEWPPQPLPLRARIPWQPGMGSMTAREPRPPTLTDLVSLALGVLFMNLVFQRVLAMPCRQASLRAVLLCWPFAVVNAWCSGCFGHSVSTQQHTAHRAQGAVSSVVWLIMCCFLFTGGKC